MSTPFFLRVTEAEALGFSRVWRGTVFSAIFSPILFLLAMGIGLGELVNEGTGEVNLAGIEYLAFLAPGLLVANAMQTGAGESSWPVMAGIKWRKTFYATLSTPVRVFDLVLGWLTWVQVRILFGSVIFVVTMSLFGAVPLWKGALAIFPTQLTGLAFSTPMIAYTARLKDEKGLSSIYRFAIIPLFLFSGTFFPVSQLPVGMEQLAYFTPLWHGVYLARSIALGGEAIGGLGVPDLSPLLSVGYLLLWAAVGGFFAVRFLHRRLIK